MAGAAGAGLTANPATPGGRGAQTPTSQGLLYGAADAWGIPRSVLLGVWGAETNYGNDVNTSTAGAIGDFQFEPGTAAKYGYPLTNNPTPAQFVKQADAAAHYLHDLYHQTGNWNAALNAYNGNGSGSNPSAYTEAVSKKGGLAAGNAFTNALDQAGNAIAAPLKAAVSVGQFLGDLTDPHLWLRVVMGIGAFLLIGFGLLELGGHGDAPKKLAKRTATAAAAA